MRDLKQTVGSGSKETEMNATVTQIATPQVSGLIATTFAIFLGVGMIAIAGHLQASTLHAAAHDVRHATGFPCH